MNYILIALSVALAIALFYVKYLVSENTILKENEKVIIEAYENSIEQIEKKAKFEKEVIIQKEPVVKASERVKVETKKRGEINENNTNSEKVVVQKELLCFDLQDVSISEDVKIRVYPYDVELFNARNEELKSAIEFYKNQNRLYRLECEKWQEDFLECFYNLW